MNDKAKSTPARQHATGGAARKAGHDGERIAKRLARAGIASRREAEAMIADGRVKLNGAILSSPAINVGPNDEIEVDGNALPPIERTRLFLFHKPSGVVTTNRDPQGRRTVFDVLPEALPRVITIGRLDLNTEGLLLLTNDGGLARVLELPATGWLRRYRVRVHGKVDPAMLEGLKDGIAVDGVFYGSIEASLDRVQGTNAWLTIGLREGKNREIRTILGALKLDVTRLIRISYGPFQLGELASGAVQEIKGRTLRDQLGERLIRETGANFEAPVAAPFANKPVVAEPAKKPVDATAPARKRERTPAAAPQPVSPRQQPLKNRRRDREESRENALGRMETRPVRPRKRADEPKKDEVQGRRKANVWMGPGARPLRQKATQDAPESAATGSRPAGKDKPRSVRPVKSGGKAASAKKDPNQSFRRGGSTSGGPRGGARTSQRKGPGGKGRK